MVLFFHFSLFYTCFRNDDLFEFLLWSAFFIFISFIFAFLLFLLILFVGPFDHLCFFVFFFGTKFIPFTNYAIFSFSYSKPSAGCDLPRRFYEDRELTVFFKNAYVPMSNQANLVEACKKMSFCICFSFLLFSIVHEKIVWAWKSVPFEKPGMC